MSKYTENEQQRKTLPYSIKEIGGPDDLKKWKEGQVVEWAEFQRRRQAKFDAIKGMSTEWACEKYESPAVAAYNRTYKQQIIDEYIHKKESFSTKLTNKAIDWFLSLKF